VLPSFEETSVPPVSRIGTTEQTGSNSFTRGRMFSGGEF